MRDAKRFSNLAYLVAASVAITAAVAIVALLWAKQYGLGVTSALASVVGGGAWVALMKAKKKKRRCRRWLDR